MIWMKNVENKKKMYTHQTCSRALVLVFMFSFQRQRRKDRDRQKKRKEMDLPGAVSQISKWAEALGCLLSVVSACWCLVFLLDWTVQSQQGKEASWCCRLHRYQTWSWKRWSLVTTLQNERNESCCMDGQTDCRLESPVAFIRTAAHFVWSLKAARKAAQTACVATQRKSLDFRNKWLAGWMDGLMCQCSGWDTSSDTELRKRSPDYYCRCTNRNGKKTKPAVRLCCNLPALHTSRFAILWSFL